MSWDNLVIVNDVDLGRFEPEAVSTDMPWGQASWPTQIEQAKRTLRVWVDKEYPDLEFASDRLRDRFAFTEAKTFISSAYTDVVSEAADKDEEDINLATTFATAANDALFVGAPWAFNGVFVHMLDSVNATASVMTVSYWAKNQWQSVPSQSDGTIATSGVTLGQSGTVSWSRITDWERRSLDGSNEGIYWARLKVSVTPDAGTAVTQVLAQRNPEGLRMVAALLSLHYIFRGLAMQSPEVEMWKEMANDYREEARETFAGLSATGQIPVDRDVSGAVTPSETGTSAVVRVGVMPRA